MTEILPLCVISLVCFQMQLYTFLETTLVTLLLMPHFIAFFSDEEIPGTPGTLATTFLAFGTFPISNLMIDFFPVQHINPSQKCFIIITAVLNLAFALSVMGFLIMHISLVAANTTTIEVCYLFSFFSFPLAGNSLVHHMVKLSLVLSIL